MQQRARVLRVRVHRRGGGGVGWDPLRYPYGPCRRRAKNVKLKSSWHRRRRSKILAVSLKHGKGRRGGGVQGGGGYPPLPTVYGRPNTSLVQGKGSGKWREANRCHQTATQPRVMPSPPPQPHLCDVPPPAHTLRAFCPLSISSSAASFSCTKA